MILRPRPVRTLAPLALLLAASAAAPAPAAGLPGEAAGEAAPPAPTPDPAAPPAAPEPAVKRVVFIPEGLKAQLREELKQEVLEQARREGWAAPALVPAWLSRLKLGGDVRGRFERAIFAPGNANGGEFPDFNAINTGKAFDVNGVDLANDRYLNVDQGRTRPRLRARLGVDAALGRGFSAGLRLGSGDGSTPVSSNQTLGGSGGLFSKYQLWLDRAFVQYEPVEGSLALRLGRFANPFLGTDLLWWEDLGFDGAVLEGKLALGAVETFLTGGAFPLFTSGPAFPAERSAKFVSFNKWLYAVQAGADWTPRPGLSVKLAFAFYAFDRAEGRPSHECDTNLKDVSCDSDESRPSTAQKGNTYLALRTPSAAALAAEAAYLVPRYQYFGLASRFRELAATTRAALDLSAALRLSFDGEFVYNAGFKRSEIEGAALNNRGPVEGADPLGRFVGGDLGLLGRLSAGTPELKELGDWRLRIGYRYLESDAVLDALNEPDFGLGGTNLKGYTLDLTVAFGSGVSFSARWSSADQVVGPKYAVDVLQLDLLARF